MIGHLLKLFRTTIADDTPRTCVLCGRYQDLSGLAFDTLDLIGLSEDGILSFSGNAVLLRLKRLPCRQCWGRMLAVNHSTSCESSMATDTIDDGIFCTVKNSNEWEVPHGPYPEESGTFRSFLGLDSHETKTY